MADLKTRFRGADRIPAPHLWQEITSREPSPHPSELSPARRILVAAFAMAIAVAAVTLAIRAIGGGRSRPAPETSIPSIEPKANGVIYFQLNGGDAGTQTDAIQPDGSGRSTIFGPSRYVGEIAWSPDGTRIAYVASGGARGVFVANPDGSDAHQLTNGVNDGWPSFSPDGSRILFSSTRYDPNLKQCGTGADFRCPADIYVMNADGSDVSRLTTDAASASHPAWSPDGTEIAFEETFNGTATAIYVMNADGTDARPVSSHYGGSDTSPTWSPDGTQIAFSSIRYENWGIYLVNADGTGEHTLLAKGGYVDDPVWSPDGTQIAFLGGAFAGAPDTQNNALYVMSSDGTGVREIAADPTYNVAGDIAWQPLPVSSPVSRSVSPAGAATGQAVTIAKGTVHPGGEWELTVSDDAYGPPSGPSLDFGYVGSERTSLGLAPLDGKVFGPARTGSHTSGNTVNDPLLAIWGVVSADVHDVTFVRSDGTTFPGQLTFQMPSSIVGPAQAFIIFVTDDALPTGTLVAFDTAGNQLATLNLG